MSTLVIVLTAAMVVPANGPEMVSGEIAEPQRLDLSGEWEGTCFDSNGRNFEGKVKGSVFVLTPQERPFLDLGPEYINDKGNGRITLRLGAKGPVLLGIYQHAGDKLMMCFCATKDGWPTQFKADGKCALLILHRVKARK
jgi:hypothetical protein